MHRGLKSVIALSPKSATSGSGLSLIGSLLIRSRVAGLPALTRRRSPHAQDCWHVYYGDVRVGTIAMRMPSPRRHADWQFQAWLDPIG